MNVGLGIMLASITERVGEDFVRLTVQEGDGKGPLLLSVEPVWQSPLLAVTEADGRRTEMDRDTLLVRLAEAIPEKADFLLSVHSRTSVTEMTRKRGKLQVTIGDQRTSARPAPAIHSSAELTGKTRQEFIKVQEAPALFEAIGIMSADGQVKGDKRRKLYQIDRFIELVDQMLAEWPPDRELTVLDCGCGKSYLTFALNYYVHEKLRRPCFFIGIDQNPELIAASRDIQKRLGYRNMTFAASSVQEYVPDRRVDMVLSLHACDTATDEALALGVSLTARYIVAVPCCQSALNDELDFGPLADIAAHNVFKVRMADTITDGLRVLGLQSHGYTVSVAEYVSPLDTPKNIMLRAVWSGVRRPQAYNAAIQALAVDPWLERFLRQRRHTGM